MTRGDFYIGTGPDARWIGSVNHDAFPDVIPCDIITQVNPIMFEEAVLEFLKNDKGYIRQNGDKWPWPWQDSHLTDYTYMFDLQVGRVVASSFGNEFFDPLKIKQGELIDDATLAMGRPKFPLMRMDLNNYGSNLTKAL